MGKEEEGGAKRKTTRFELEINWLISKSTCSPVLLPVEITLLVEPSCEEDALAVEAVVVLV